MRRLFSKDSLIFDVSRALHPGEPLPRLLIRRSSYSVSLNIIGTTFAPFCSSD